MVGDGGTLFQDRVGADHFPGHQVFADAEMLQRALGLRPPKLVGLNLDGPEAVRLGPHLHGHRKFPHSKIQGSDAFFACSVNMN